jgi:putative Mg2+ transporter-C (MgtC) family protein
MLTLLALSGWAGYVQRFVVHGSEDAVPLLIAAVLALPLGWERESYGKPAGLRTHVLVAIGAAAFIAAFREFAGDHANGVSRVTHGVIAGIGFVGAGSIIQSRASVKGLTTATSIWTAAAIGAASALDAYGVAVALSLIAFVVLAIERLDLFREQVKENGDADENNAANDDDREHSG